MSSIPTVLTSRHRRVVPTLMALGLMGVALQAADPVITAIGGSVGTATTVQFAVDWTDDMAGWDPLFASTTAANVGGDLHVFTTTSAYVTANAPDPSLLSLPTGATRVALANTDVISSNARRSVFTVNMTGKEKLYVQIPASSAYLAGATPTLFPSAAIPATYSQLVYTVVPTTPVATTNSITFPANNTTTTSRTPTLAVSINIDDNETNTTPQINTLFSTSDNFVVKISDSVTSAVVGTATFRKTGVAYNNATPTAQRQTIGVVLSTPLLAGPHALTATVYDPLNQAAATTSAINLMVWDTPTLMVNGDAPSGTIFSADRTNNLIFTGTKFSIGTYTSSVTLTVDGVSAGANALAATDLSKFSFTVANVAAGASHALVLTQTYTGTVVSGNPTLVSTYTLDNNTLIDTTPPDQPLISTPVSASTVSVLKPKIVGQTEPGATVKMRFTNATPTVVTLSGTVTADANGAFVINTADWGASTLVAGNTYSVQVQSTDAAGNASAWSDIGYQLTTPAAALNVAFSASAGITSPSGVNYSKTATAVFNVDLKDLAGTAVSAGATAGLAASDFVVTNGTITASTLITAGSLSITVTPTANGPVTISMLADAFSVGGTNNSAATTYTFIKDAALPVLTAAVVSNGTSTTSVGTGFKVVLTSNEALASSDATKIVITATSGTGFTAPTLGAPVLSADAKTLTVPFTSMVIGTAPSMTVAVSAAAGVDIAGNASALIASFTKTFDTTAPVVNTAGMLSSASPLVTKTAPIVFVTTFAEPVTGFDAGDFDLTNGVISTFAGTGAVYTMTVVPGEGPTAVKATIKNGTVVTDAVGNTSTFSGSISGINFLSRTYDSTAPRVLSLASSTAAPTSIDDKPTNKTSIPCSLVFSETVTGLTAAAFQVEGGSISGLTGSGSVYTFNVDVSAPTTIDKKVRVVLQAGKVADAVGNLNSAVAVLVRNYDGTAPTLDFATPTVSGTAGTDNDSKGTFVINVNNSAASDVLATKFDKSKIIAIGGTIDSITPTTSGSPLKVTAITVVVTFPRGPGNSVTLQALPGVVTDVSGNKNVLSTGVLMTPGAG